MIWRRKWTSVTWLFVANRYLMIANAIFGLMPSTAQVDIKQSSSLYSTDGRPMFMVEVNGAFRIQISCLNPDLDYSCPRGITLNNVFHLMQYFIFAGKS